MAASLVNASIPSDAPRAVHTCALSLGGNSGGNVSFRTLHQLPGVQRACGSFSRAHWSDLRLLLVPSVKLAGICVAATVAFHPDSVAVSSLDDLRELPSCQHATFGEAGVLPPVISFPVSFVDAMISPLVKPPPIELGRPAFSLHLELHSVDDSVQLTNLGKVVLMNVFAVGHLEVGGQSI